MSDLFIDILEYCPDFHELKENYDEIHEELIENYSSIALKDFTSDQSDHIRDHKKGFPVTFSTYITAKDSPPDLKGWHVATVTESGVPDPYNQRALPKLSSLICSFGEKVTVSAINVLGPNCSLDWHSDADYALSSSLDTLRNIWVLDAPKAEGRSAIIQMKNADTSAVETKIFDNNSFYSFKHTTMHRVENNLHSPRVVLVFDVIL